MEIKRPQNRQEESEVSKSYVQKKYDILRLQYRMYEQIKKNKVGNSQYPSSENNWMLSGVDRTYGNAHIHNNAHRDRKIDTLGRYACRQCDVKSKCTVLYVLRIIAA